MVINANASNTVDANNANTMALVRIQTLENTFASKMKWWSMPMHPTLWMPQRQHDGSSSNPNVGKYFCQ